MTSKSAQKQVRVSSRRRLRNKSVRSTLKTNITKAEKLLFTGEVGEAEKTIAEAVASLDRAASKGIIHDNNATAPRAVANRRRSTISSAIGISGSYSAFFFAVSNRLRAFT